MWKELLQRKHFPGGEDRIALAVETLERNEFFTISQLEMSDHPASWINGELLTAAEQHFLSRLPARRVMLGASDLCFLLLFSVLFCPGARRRVHVDLDPAGLAPSAALGMVDSCKMFCCICIVATCLQCCAERSN